jgi:hypothetical protein
MQRLPKTAEGHATSPKNSRRTCNCKGAVTWCLMTQGFTTKPDANRRQFGSLKQFWWRAGRHLTVVILQVGTPFDNAGPTCFRTRNQPERRGRVGRHGETGQSPTLWKDWSTRRNGAITHPLSPAGRLRWRNRSRCRRGATRGSPGRTRSR